MGRPRKEKPPKGPLEAAIGATLSAWMAKSLGKRYRTETKRIAALAKRSGVGIETIRQIVKAQQSARIDNLNSLVEALGHDLHDLFAPKEGHPAVEEPRADGPLQHRSTEAH